MSFTDGNPWTVTKKDETLPWSGRRDGSHFRCGLCGHRFKEGDVCRWVFANGKESPSHRGNFFVCEGCDGDDVLDRAAVDEREHAERFWWAHGS